MIDINNKIDQKQLAKIRNLLEKACPFDPLKPDYIEKMLKKIEGIYKFSDGTEEIIWKTR